MSPTGKLILNNCTSLKIKAKKKIKKEVKRPTEDRPIIPEEMTVELAKKIKNRKVPGPDNKNQNPQSDVNYLRKTKLSSYVVRLPRHTNYLMSK